MLLESPERSLSLSIYLAEQNRMREREREVAMLYVYSVALFPGLGYVPSRVRVRCAEKNGSFFWKRRGDINKVFSLDLYPASFFADAPLRR